MKYSSYMTRAMKAKRPIYREVLGELGYLTRDKTAPEPAPEPVDELPALRAEYEAVIGRRPYMGWDAGTLRMKIAEAGET